MPVKRTLDSMSDEIVGATAQRLDKIGSGYNAVVEVQAGGMLKKTGAIRVWSQLENLHRNRLITPHQYDAGEQYYRDWYIGFQASAQITMKWSEHISGLAGGGDMDAAERKVFHVRRFASANQLLETMGLRKTIHWLCINDLPPHDVGRRLRGYRNSDSAKASGTTAVAIGLQALARFYGFSK